jgi:hypothetical protein
MRTKLCGMVKKRVAFQEIIKHFRVKKRVGFQEITIQSHPWDMDTCVSIKLESMINDEA